MSFADDLRARAKTERTAALAALAASDDLASAAAAMDSIAGVLESSRQRIAVLVEAAEQLRAEVGRLRDEVARLQSQPRDQDPGCPNKPIDNWRPAAPSMAASDD